MCIDVIQYLMPFGEQRAVWIDDMPDDLAPIIKQMSRRGLKLAAEMLTTGEISFSVESRKYEDDFDIEIAENGPGEKGTQASFERLIRRFDPKKYREWAKQFKEGSAASSEVQADA